MKNRKHGNATSSTQFKILIIPLVFVFLGIVIIGFTSSYLIRESLLSDMKNNGFTTSQRFVTQLEKNNNTIKSLTDANAGMSSDQIQTLTEKFSYQTAVDGLSDDQSVVYVAMMDKKAVDIADSVQSDIGKDYSDDPATKDAVTKGISSASEYYYEPQKTTVYDVIYPAKINGELIGAIDIGYSMESVNAAITHNILLISGIGLLIFLLLAMLLYRISKSITGPIIGVNHMIQEMNQMDLSERLMMEPKNEIGEMAVALDSFADNLQRVMNEIDNAAGQVETGASQISIASQALAQGTTEQAGSIQELTASIEQVDEETRRNAENVDEANALATEVRSHAEAGNDQMSQMLVAMEAINEASSNISKIIKVIDDIAFQTNILALNAAVEAAQAGQYGKGFAVVAQEVRTLAGRSAEAVKETTELIEVCIGKVKAGTKIADETAQSLREILSQIDQVSDLVSHIDQASNNQATEIDQITIGIEQVAQVVQTNSATAEESAAASEELTSQAEMLKQMVDVFAFSRDNTGFKNAPHLSALPKAATIATVEPRTVPSAMETLFESQHTISQAEAEPCIALDEFDKY